MKRFARIRIAEKPTQVISFGQRIWSEGSTFVLRTARAGNICSYCGKMIKKGSVYLCIYVLRSEDFDGTTIDKRCATCIGNKVLPERIKELEILNSNIGRGSFTVIPAVGEKFTGLFGDSVYIKSGMFYVTVSRSKKKRTCSMHGSNPSIEPGEPYARFWYPKGRYASGDTPETHYICEKCVKEHRIDTALDGLIIREIE